MFDTAPLDAGEVKQLLVNFAEEYRDPYRFMNNEEPPHAQRLRAQAALLAETLPKFTNLLTAQYQAGYKAAIADVREKMPEKIKPASDPEHGVLIEYLTDTERAYNGVLASLSDILDNLEKK